MALSRSRYLLPRFSQGSAGWDWSPPSRARSRWAADGATHSVRIARGAFAIIAVSGLAGVVALAALVVVALDDFSEQAQVALAAGLGLPLYGSNAVAVGGSVARGAGRVIRMELPLLSTTLCRLAAVLLLTALGIVEITWVALGYGIAALVGIALAVLTTSSIVGRARRFLLPDLAAGRAVFGEALPFAVVGIAAVALSRFDVVILGLSGTDTEVGAYEPVLRIVEQIMLIVPLLFVAQYLPVATRVHAGGDVDGFRELYLALSKLAYVLAFPGVLILAAFPESVIETLYGADFPFDPLVVRLLLVGFVVNLCFGLNASALGSVGNTWCARTIGRCHDRSDADPGTHPGAAARCRGSRARDVRRLHRLQLCCRRRVVSCGRSPARANGLRRYASHFDRATRTCLLARFRLRHRRARRGDGHLDRVVGGLGGGTAWCTGSPQRGASSARASKWGSGVSAAPTPLVSVVVPTRDRPRLAERAVASALSQSYANLEVIVVDDGSQPPVVLAPELRSDPRVRVSRFEDSVGPAAARNAGVHAAGGSLIAFLDDDDSWRPHKIALQVSVLAGSGESIAAVESGFDLWQGDRLVTRYVPAIERDLTMTLLEKPCLQPSTVLMRKTAFDALGGFDESLRRVEDWDLWVRFADVYRAAALPEVLVDRDESNPGDELEWYVEIVRRLEPRIRALPRAEQTRIRAVHLLVEAHLLFKAGRTHDARVKSMTALRIHPRSVPRSSLYVVRSFIGERVWSAGKGLLHRTRAEVHRSAGSVKGLVTQPRARTPEGDDR